MSRCEWCGTNPEHALGGVHTANQCRDYLKAALGAANRADAEARELNVVLAKYVIYVHPRQKDNACSRCMATEPLPNFVCGWHRAADIVDALDPERHQ